MSEFNKNKYIDEWQKENYSRIVLKIPKDDAEYIKQCAKDLGYKSVTRFIVDAIMEKITRG